MFKHLLVPLDGSHLAESALVVAVQFALAIKASITLIHIVEEDAPKEIHKDRHLTNSEEAVAYLQDVARREVPAEVRVDLHVHTDKVKNVARSIFAHSQELQPDLVVMCTHGSSGPKEWLLGSIAQQVIAIGSTPVLLIPSKVGSQLTFHCERALVPLDGDPEHEHGLLVAQELANACHMALHLLMVIPTLSNLKVEQAAVGQILPTTMRALLDMSEQGGKDYLLERLKKLEENQITTSAEIKRGDPVANIISTAEDIQADLIVLGTHGKAGMDAFLSESVAPKLSSRSHIPLLLVPVRQ